MKAILNLSIFEVEFVLTSCEFNNAIINYEQSDKDFEDMYEISKETANLRVKKLREKLRKLKTWE